VVGAISEVMPHPNADRLTLCRLFDGREEHIVLTARQPLEFKGIGPLAQPLKVAYAKEGSVIYDGHQPGLVLTTLKKTRIRGVDSDSMVCSEKNLVCPRSMRAFSSWMRMLCPVLPWWMYWVMQSLTSSCCRVMPAAQASSVWRARSLP